MPGVYVTGDKDGKTGVVDRCEREKKQAVKDCRERGIGEDKDRTGQDGARRHGG